MDSRTFDIRIESDFTDYYDHLGIKNEKAITYRRNYSDSQSRVQDFKLLNSLGIPTIELKSGREFDGVNSSELVIYTSPKLHNSQGKQIVSIDTARLMYPNNLASKFYRECNGITNKLLQIGSRRFRIILQNNGYSLDEGEVTSIQELSNSLNFKVGIPIFSIDYIPTVNGLVAVDFNQVQNLDKLGMKSYISAESVMVEIKKALLAYNKI